ncbi:MAG: TIGR00730 family Rossman fold protein [Pseudomonadota bacterium]
MDICVYCGSSAGHDPAFRAAAESMGQHIGTGGHRLVYGGGKVGLMGAVADATLAAGGPVTGIMPQALVDREIAHKGLTDLIVVDSMHTRKTVMAEKSDAFVAMPGGAGTFEEIFEQWTWAQLGIHQKPVGFLNVDGYYDPLLAMIDRAAQAGFMKPEYATMVIVETEPDQLITRFADYEAPAPKWQDSAPAVRP